jgi:hypothetical protein
MREGGAGVWGCGGVGVWGFYVGLGKRWEGEGEGGDTVQDERLGRVFLDGLHDQDDSGDIPYCCDSQPN